MKEGRLGHVGTGESIDMIGAAFGWNLSDVQVEIAPVMSKKEVKSAHLTVPAGTVAGIRQVGRGLRGEDEMIHLDLQMYMGARKPRDSILIEGNPGIEVTIPGGVRGDEATVAAVVNAIPAVRAAEPGLKTMLDLKLPSYVEWIWKEV